MVAPEAAAANPVPVAAVGPVVRRLTSSDLLEGETGTEGFSGVVAGIEKPTTLEVGRALRDGPGAGVAEVAGRRRDAHDFLGAGTAGMMGAG